MISWGPTDPGDCLSGFSAHQGGQGHFSLLARDKCMLAPRFLLKALAGMGETGGTAGVGTRVT